MRALLAFAAIALISAPALAQQQKRAASPPRVDTTEAEVQRALADPATADKLARMIQSLSNVFLNLPVGELEAAVEGRPATAADKGKTVLSEGRKDDPNFDRNFQQQMANAKPILQSSMKALGAALPAIMQGMSQMSKELDRATQNMPRPNYPKR